MGFSGKTVIVTGAARGIGEQVARGFGKIGAKVMVSDLNAEGATRVAKAIKSEGGKAESASIDVTKASEAERLVRETFEIFGGLDVLVNCAGVMARKQLFEVTEEDWDFHMNANAKGTFFCGQAAARWMTNNGVKGRIVNVASILSFVPLLNLRS